MSRLHIDLAIFLFLVLAPWKASGQTISPVISEYRGSQAEGAFQIRNGTLSPFTVVLRPMSFSVGPDGKANYRPLDTGISLQLSSNSFLVPPHRQFTVYYHVLAAHIPAWFTIYAAIVPKTRDGRINLVIDLPHTVYLLNKKPLSSQDVAFTSAEVNPAKGQLLAIVENTSHRFGRVTEIEVSSKSAKQTYAGFPLFPGQSRVIRLRWEKRGNPRRIQLQFSRFKLGDTLRIRGTSR